MKQLRMNTPVRQTGRSLIEIMIGLVLGLIVIGAAAAAYLATTKATQVTEVESRLNENAAITMGILQQQLRLAGYSEVFGSSTYTIRKNFNDAGLRGCSGGFNTPLTVTFPAITCLNGTQPDSFVVRYQANANNTIPAAGGVPTNCIGETITGSTPSAATSSAVGAPVPPAYVLAENRFYVRTTGTPSGGPELYCLGLRGTNTFSTPQPIMEGVERIQLTYGVAATPTGTVTTAYMTGTAIDTTFSAEPNRWQRVVSVRLCIIMRSVDGSQAARGIADSSTNTYFDCNNVQTTSSDGRLRRAYTTTVALKNQLSRF
jgi:type IV pilus assembly protein PilW